MTTEDIKRKLRNDYPELRQKMASGQLDYADIAHLISEVLADHLREENKEEADGGRLRIAIEVVAGLIPGRPMEEHYRRFVITSDAYYAQGAYEGKEKEALLKVLEVYGTAQEYARSLMNPNSLNWVRLDWIYF